MFLVNSSAKEAFKVKECTLYLDAHFGTLTQCSVHPKAPVLLTKDSRNEISYDFQPPYLEF